MKLRSVRFSAVAAVIGAAVCVFAAVTLHRVAALWTARRIYADEVSAGSADRSGNSAADRARSDDVVVDLGCGAAQLAVAFHTTAA